jgi:hypothetical protein
MKADNDNSPRYADSFATPQERHAHVASQPDIRLRRAGAVPLATRLARAGRAEDLQRLIDHGVQRRPASWLEANENLPEGGKMGGDIVMEMRPSEKELKAAGKGGVRRDAKGAIAEWRGSDGRWRPPVELWRQPKGSRKSEVEHQEDAARHLAVRSTSDLPWFELNPSPASEGEDFRRLRAAHWVQALGVSNDNARVMIDRVGIGATVPFHKARTNARLAPSERGLTVVAKGAGWLAFRVHSNPKAAEAGVEGGHSMVEDAVIAGIDNSRKDAALGEHAAVLDDSLFGLTAREIAAKRGWGNSKGAEERAVRAQDRALAALEKLTA